MSKDDKKVYLKLRDIRKKKGLTLSSLAKKTGMDTQKIGRMERGETQITVDVLQNVARVLNVPVSKLFEESEKVNISAEDSRSDLVNIIPIIYRYIDEFCIKHDIHVDSEVKVHISTVMFKTIQDMQKDDKDGEGSVKALFQGFDAIFERLFLSQEK